MIINADENKYKPQNIIEENFASNMGAALFQAYKRAVLNNHSQITFFMKDLNDNILNIDLTIATEEGVSFNKETK